MLVNWPRNGYKVKYPRTTTWWTKDWEKISSWCNESMGPGNWEYIDQCFYFENKEDSLAFVLKWMQK